jgi:hypothetical protein
MSMSHPQNRKSTRLNAAFRAGMVYAGVVFAFGFMMGTIRALFVSPAIGEIYAVMLEIPVMLAVSWLSCLLVIRQFNVGTALAGRLTMGILAFCLLMMAEACLSMIALGVTLSQHLETYRAPAAILGLGAQIVFGALPVIQLALRS